MTMTTRSGMIRRERRLVILEARGGKSEWEEKRRKADGGDVAMEIILQRRQEQTQL